VKTYAAVLIALLATFVASGSPAPPIWTEGKHYYPVASVAGSMLPSGTIEVTEVFSYGCPACAQFNPVARKLQQSLPEHAKLVYVPASFNPREDWPMFQRA
jgi:protein dithiol oxidoreductase (disulfide-forming)